LEGSVPGYGEDSIESGASEDIGGGKGEGY